MGVVLMIAMRLTSNYHPSWHPEARSLMNQSIYKLSAGCLFLGLVFLGSPARVQAQEEKAAVPATRIIDQDVYDENQKLIGEVDEIIIRRSRRAKKLTWNSAGFSDTPNVQWPPIEPYEWAFSPPRFLITGIYRYDTQGGGHFRGALKTATSEASSATRERRSLTFSRTTVCPELTVMRIPGEPSEKPHTLTSPIHVLR
jgi:hypothetical protein